MSAPKRSSPRPTIVCPKAYREMVKELRRIEEIENVRLRSFFPSIRYNGEVVKFLAQDVWAVVGPKDWLDWRRPIERTADRLKAAATHICDAVRLLERAISDCPTQSKIPEWVWTWTPEGEAEEQRVASLPDGEKLFGSGGRIESLTVRERRKVLDLEKIAPDFCRAMTECSTQLKREAERLQRILKLRERRFDRIGPILTLIQDVQGATGSKQDDAIARLLADAFEAVGSKKKHSGDAIRKLRERYLPLPPPSSQKKIKRTQLDP